MTIDLSKIAIEKKPFEGEMHDLMGGSGRWEVKVHDHGLVALIDVMPRLAPLGKTADFAIVQAARVSYGAGTKQVNEDRGLIRYLARHRHTTPFEMVEFKFHHVMPIFIARQWIRHRTACLAEGTEVYFDLPGGIGRRGNQLYKLPIEEIARRFEPTRNTQRPDKQRNQYFRRDRLRGMRLRQVNEDDLRIQHTRIVNVYRNGTKPVFRMTLADGKQIESTADHQFFFADGWHTLKAATGLHLAGGRAVSNAGDHFLYVNGTTREAPALYQDRDWLSHIVPVWDDASIAREEPNVTTLCSDRDTKVAKLVRIERFEYVGEKPTYDLEVEGPYHNFIANGVVTHNSVNEYSARYSVVQDRFYHPTIENVRKQSASNRQGGEEPIDPVTAQEFLAYLDKVEEAYKEYQRLMDKGVAREIARIGLPVNVYTEWYWKIDLHNLFHFLSLRMDAHAQQEIRDYANAMYALIQPIVPIAAEAFLDYNFGALHLSRLEVEALKTGKPLASENKRENAEWEEKKKKLFPEP